MKKSLLYVTLIVGIASCAKAPVPSQPVAQLQSDDNKKARLLEATDNKTVISEKIIDDFAFPENRQIEDQPEDKSISQYTVLVDDVGKYLKQADAPKRKGEVKFTAEGHSR
jgi:hypothetical protein